MSKTLLIVLIVAVVILAFWFLQSPTTEAPAPVSGDSAAAIQAELDDVDVNSLDADFQSIDADIQSL